MMYSTKNNGRADINNAIEKKTWFPIIRRDNRIYCEILDYLGKCCDPDIWTIRLTHELIGESARELPRSVQKLFEQYRIRTEISWRYKDHYTIITSTDICHCTPEAIDLLKSYENFFAIEDKLDVAFYEGETCLLRTVNHEQKLNLNLVFFQNLTSIIESEKHLPKR